MVSLLLFLGMVIITCSGSSLDDVRDTMIDCTPQLDPSLGYGVIELRNTTRQCKWILRPNNTFHTSSDYDLFLYKSTFEGELTVYSLESDAVNLTLWRRYRNGVLKYETLTAPHGFFIMANLSLRFGDHLKFSYYQSSRIIGCDMFSGQPTIAAALGIASVILVISCVCGLSCFVRRRVHMKKKAAMLGQQTVSCRGAVAGQPTPQNMPGYNPQSYSNHAFNSSLCGRMPPIALTDSLPSYDDVMNSAKDYSPPSYDEYVAGSMSPP